MAHFAKIDENGIVTLVLVVNNDQTLDENNQESEQVGIEYLNTIFGEVSNWKKTSYNTRGGIYYNNNEPAEDQSKSFRKNYAGLGYSYDTVRDAFIPPKPDGEGWILDEDSCTWINLQS